jgi:cytochrome P450
VDHVHEHRRALVEVVADAPSGSLAASVLHETGDGDEGRDLAARHLLGLTVGPLALVHRAVADAVDLLLARPWELDAATDEHQARRTFVAALRHRPPLPGVLRQVPEDTDVYSGTQLVEVPKGLVLAATACPARLGEADGPELAFGHGVHRCMGEQHTTDVATVVLQALAPRRPRRAPGPGGRLRRAPAPSGVDEWDVPGHLEVALR